MEMDLELGVAIVEERVVVIVEERVVLLLVDQKYQLRFLDQTEEPMDLELYLQLAVNSMKSLNQHGQVKVRCGSRLHFEQCII